MDFASFVNTYNQLNYFFKDAEEDPNLQYVPRALRPTYYKVLAAKTIKRYFLWIGDISEEEIFAKLPNNLNTHPDSWRIYAAKLSRETFHEKLTFDWMKAKLFETGVITEIDIDNIEGKLKKEFDSIARKSFFITWRIFEIIKSKTKGEDLVQITMSPQEVFSICLKNSEETLLDMIEKLASNTTQSSVLFESKRPKKTSSSPRSSEYKRFDSINTVQNLANFIKKGIKTFADSADFHSPLVAVCQSSGYGKTRLAMQLKEHFFVLYVCFRKEMNNEYPPRSPLIADLFENVKNIADLKAHYLSVLIAMVAAADQLSSGKTSTEFFDNYLLNTKKFYEVAALQYEILEPTQRNKEFLQALLKEFFAKHQKEIVFVFDEARALLQTTSVTVPQQKQQEKSENTKDINATDSDDGPRTYFRVLISISRLCKPSCFFIMIDTSSRISNFSPSASWDPSLRIVVNPKVDLFPPFTEVATIGLVTVEAKFFREYSESITLSENLKMKINRFELVDFNRPMYPVFLEDQLKGSQQPDGSALWNSLMNFACSKLMGEVYGKPYDSWDPLERLIPMAVKFGVIPLTSWSNEKLVANHMATLRSLSFDRSILDSTYVLEPIHGEGASCLLFDKFQEALTNLYRLRMSGNLGILQVTGDVGEFLAAIILSRAFDCTAYDLDPISSMKSGVLSPSEKPAASPQFPFFGRPIIAEKFFKTLTGNENYHLPAQGSSNQNRLCLLSFLQFIQIYRPITQAMLRDSYQRRAALLCKKMQPGIDICIPIAIGPKSNRKETLSGPLALSSEKFSGIFIQVKNYHSTFSVANIDKWFEEMEAVADEIVNDLPYYSVLMVVGSCFHQSYSLTNNAVSNRRTRILLQRIETSTYPFLTPDECNLMQLLAVPYSRPEYYFDKICKIYEQEPQILEDHLYPIGGLVVPTKHTTKGKHPHFFHPLTSQVERKIKRLAQRERPEVVVKKRQKKKEKKAKRKEEARISKEMSSMEQEEEETESDDEEEKEEKNKEQETDDSSQLQTLIEDVEQIALQEQASDTKKTLSK